MKPVHVLHRRVAFSETDAAGIAHFSRYFVWMEDCEHAFWRAAGVPVHAHDEDGERLFPRVAAQASYSAPLAFDQAFEVRQYLQELRAKVIVWRFEVVPEGAAEPSATGSTTVVFARHTADGMRAAPLPDALVDAIRRTGALG